MSKGTPDVGFKTHATHPSSPTSSSNRNVQNNFVFMPVGQSGIYYVCCVQLLELGWGLWECKQIVKAHVGST